MGFQDIFDSVLRTEAEVSKAYFFKNESSTVRAFELEETYFKLKLSRMFIRHSREFFQTKYPVVHALMRFAGMDEILEVHQVITPSVPGDAGAGELKKVIMVDQILLGPILYRGDSLELLIGLYAAPGDDWAEKFISLAQSVSAIAIQGPVSTAIALAKPVKESIDGLLKTDSLKLKTGLKSTLEKKNWFQPGYLAIISAPANEVDQRSLRVKEGILVQSSNGKYYEEHDYFLLEIEALDRREDWQRLGFGSLWNRLLELAAEEDDKERVGEKYMQFTGAVLASPDLSWTDRQTIVKLAQDKITRIRELRSTAFLETLRSEDELDRLKILKNVSSSEFQRARSQSDENLGRLLDTGWI
jgi:hypothetical protein